MALWSLAPSAGQAITAQLVKATPDVSDTAYFGAIGLATVALAGVLFTVAPWVTRHIRSADTLDAVEHAA